MGQNLQNVHHLKYEYIWKTTIIYNNEMNNIKVRYEILINVKLENKVNFNEKFYSFEELLLVIKVSNNKLFIGIE